jgi:tetratricopeptide (TPR) repeat protein
VAGEATATTGQRAAVAAAGELSAAGDWAAAVPAWAAVVRRNPVHGGHRLALARAREGAGDLAGALAAYDEALALGVWPPPANTPAAAEAVLPAQLAYDAARCHARLGHEDQALAGLARALRLGLRDTAGPRTDEAFAALRDDPRFAALAGDTDHSGLSRADGWRSDLALLVAEIRRRTPLSDRTGPGRLGADFDEAVADLDEAVEELDDVQVAVGMWSLLRQLGDGHAFLDASEVHPEWEHRIAVWFFRFAEGVYVTDAAAPHADLAGAELVAVDGEPVEDVLAALDPFLTRDNDYGPLSRSAVWLRKPVYLHALGVAAEPDRLTLTVRRPGGERTEVTVEAAAGAEPIAAWPKKCPPRAARAVTLPAYLRDPDTPWWFERQDDLVYFQFNSIGDTDGETLAAFFARLFAAVDEHNPRALVLDLRWNGGGNTFLALPLLHALIRRPDLPVYVITGRNTFSAAQNTATYLSVHTGAVFVGEPTGSSPNFTGETMPFTLPYSGLQVNVSDLYWQSSWPLDHRTAIAPDLYAPPTYAAYAAGRDPAMDAIRADLS